MATGIQRNLETGGEIYLNRFMSGQVTNRSPLFTPISAMGLQVISRMDALWDGLNMEISPQLTVVRSYGFSRYCSTAFGSSDYPLAFYSFKNLSGTIKLLVDTPTKLVAFTTSAQATVFSKSASTQGSCAKVANQLFYCDGNDADKKKWDGTTATNWGIVAPAVAPTLSFSSGALSPTSGYRYVYVYKNSSTGHISTASAPSAATGALTSKNIVAGYTASSDTQVDHIDIYRTADGGSLFYFLATVANGTSTYTDSTADSGLNDDIVAPIAHVNDPPPSGISLTVWHAGRLWAATGNALYYSGGPDTTNGVGTEAWPPANNFLVPGAITALASTSQGLIVSTSDNLYMVLGQDSTTFTVPQLWQRNFGVPSQNCIAQDGDLLFLYTSTAQLYQLSSSLDEVGNMIADKLSANFPPASSYLALHRNGQDQGLWISNGLNKMRRYSVMTQAWDVERQVVNGAGAIASIEATTANWKLFTGRTAGSGYILARDTTTYQDDGTSYSAFATIGSLTVAPPGQVARIDDILLQLMPVGTYPTVSVLLNEISGSFTALPNPVNDPPSLAASSTVTQKRHYLKSAQTPLPQQANHLQIKVSFVAENTRSELLALGVA
jgi:hypothetical protein